MPGNPLAGLEHRELREQEADRRLGTAILVHAVFGEAVEATAGFGIVERNALSVASEKPFEGQPGAAKVEGLGGGVEAGERGLYHGARVDGLLIVERGLVGVVAIPAVVADEAERVAEEGLLREEAHGAAGDVEVLVVVGDLVGAEEGLGELGVGIGHLGQEPFPAGLTVLPVACDQVVGERTSKLVRSCRLLRPGLNPAMEGSDAEGSAAGMLEPGDPRDTLVEHLLCRADEAGL